MPSIINATTTNGLSTSADNSGSLQLATNNGTTAVTIDTSQNVGIGTSSPTTKLGINGATQFIGVSPALFPTTGSGIEIVGGVAGQQNYIQAYNRTGSTWQNLDIASGLTTLSVSGSERMRIASGGEVLVGTSSTWFGRGMVVQNGSDALACINDAATAYPLSVQNTATSGNNIFVGFWTEARGLPAARGTIDYNRGAGQVRYNTTSDATLKNLIGDSDKQKSVEILNTTKIREFAWKDDAEQKPQIGVIAQELYETYKGAVSVGGDVEKTDEEGNVTTEYKPWGVDKTAFTFHLIAGWQEHEKMIKELKALVEAQAVRIAELEGAK